MLQFDNILAHDGAVTVDGYGGIAFYVVGVETVPDDDTYWTGSEVETGNIMVVMVGDDRRHVVDPNDVTPIGDDEYCPECGQLGCRAYR